MIPIQTDSRLCLYEQIYQYIKREIIDGSLSQGERLPSTRLLSKQLKISRSTIELAYGQLKSEGYLESIPGSGYFICDIEGIHQEQPVEKGNVDDQIRKKSQEEFQIDFSLNGVEWSTFSMNAWRKASKLTLMEDLDRLLASGDSNGEEKLRQSISDYLHRSRGVKCSRDQIIIGAGNEYLLMLLSQILSGDKGDGNHIAMENATYLQAYQIFKNLDWKIDAVEMDQFGMMPGLLRKTRAEIVYLMPSHQFPLGITMPLKRRQELLGWAKEDENRYIIEDDYDSEFRYVGRPIPSMQGLDPYEKVIYIGTFSKSIAPSIRISYMVLPVKLMKLYQDTLSFYASTVARMQQQTLYHFITEGYFERHLNKMRGIYKSKRDCLLEELKKQSWIDSVYGEEAGLHLRAQIDASISERELIARAKEHEVRVYGLSEYLISQREIESHPMLLFGYAGKTEAEIREGIQRLQKCF